MRLTHEQRREIQARNYEGTPAAALAKEYGVSRPTIHNIIYGRVALIRDNTPRGKRCQGCGWMIYKLPCLNCKIEIAERYKRRTP